MRGMLERLDHTVKHVAAMDSSALERTTQPLTVAPIEYNLLDLLSDFFANPGGVASVGGSQFPDEYPDVEPCGTFPTADEARGRVAIIGHSAGGWIARIFMSQREYGGKAFGGSKLVHSLVTLGTPHQQGASVPFYSVEWINREPPPEDVRCLAVGGRGTLGTDNSISGGAYSFCEPSGQGGEMLDGDGLTTLDSAVGLEGAQTLVLDGVTHYPWSAAPLADLLVPELAAEYASGAKPWYGSASVLPKWLPWLLEPFGPAGDGSDGRSMPKGGGL